MIIFVLVSFIICMMLGYVWYADFLFGKIWRKKVGLSSKEVSDKARMSMGMMMMTIGVLALIFGVNYILSLIAVMNLMEAVLLVTGIWFAFGVGTVIGNHAFSQRAWELFLIDYGYVYLMVLVITGARFLLV